jgi:hypothetical protein
MEDCLTCESFSANPVTQDLFKKIVEAGKKAYAAEAATNGERLVINAKWTDSTVNADCCRGCTAGQVTVNMYGGLARRSEVTPEGFALVLGHELSHAYGGTPYIDVGSRMSAEGQSDYEGAKTAFYRIAALVPELRKEADFSDTIKNACKGKVGDANVDCMHDLSGGLSLGHLLSVLSGDSKPAYETPDTTQCRVDT